ncbi:hypothetical protein GJ629_14915 [Halapricum sp. CBA1109]|uniref:DUF5518 domain-containing protein n=1 Tax=Halapricum sp. CBA1109 TaxID=2668068 RepID=UPI0012F8B36F|nr:DUF5518 domain-containing protein [Halapricum sp. CBA1109]MUV91017.1 hypothetical protein [Halapricum sp. CBA1109]
MKRGSTLVNSGIGAAVTLVTSFVAISPVFGGGIGAYLQGGDRSEALLVGAISGGIAALPFLFFGVTWLGFLDSFSTFGPPGLSSFGPSIDGSFAVFGQVVILMGVAYIVLLSALGGFIGWYIREETTIDDDLRDAL